MSPAQVLTTVRLAEVGPMLQKAYERRRNHLADMVRVTHSADPVKLLEALKPPKLVDASEGWKSLALDFGRPDLAEKIELQRIVTEIRSKKRA